MQKKSTYKINTAAAFLTLLTLLLSFAGAHAQGWYDTNWQYRKEITIDATQVDANLTNFPLLVDVIDTDLDSTAQPDGDDILFTADDGTSQLDHEIEFYSAGNLVAWVKIPSLSSSANTVVYMYYGNSSTSNQENTTGVWDANYVMVHHLEETGTHYDSTTSGYDGNPQGGVSQNVDGKIGKADEFDGTDDYISISPFNRSSDTQGTVEAWVIFDQIASDQALFQYYVDAQNRCKLVNDQSHTERLRFNLKENDVWEIIIDGNNPISPATWYHLAITQDGTTSRLYVNGAVQTVTDSGEWLDDIGSGTGFIGVSTTGTSWPGFLDGIIDEVKVSNSPRSAGWLITQYNNQNDPSSFYTIGAEVNTDAPFISDPDPADGATDVSADLSQLSFTIGDPNGDSMDYTVTTNPDIGSDSATGAANGTYTLSLSGLQGSETYLWTVEVTDGTYITSRTFTFTTVQTSPSISNPNPPDGAISIPFNPTLSADISDPQSDSVNWEIWTDASGSWQMIANGTLPTGSGTPQAISINMNQYATEYFWRVEADDGTNVVQETFSFTTEGRTPVISNPDPPDGIIDVTPNPELSVDVSDPDGELMDITFWTHSPQEVEEETPNSETFLQGWNKLSPGIGGNPIEIYTGDMGIAPKNTLNSPVVIRIDGTSYKEYDWVFMHLDTDPATNQNFLAVEFATHEDFLIDNWTEELEIYGTVTEPFDAIIIDGTVYMWGHVDSNGPMEQQKVSVTTSTDWENWTTPEVTVDTDLPWKDVRTRGFTLQKVPGQDQYLAFFAAQTGSTFSIGRATATLEQLVNNNWQEDPSNPLITGADVSWDANGAVLYPYLLPMRSDGSWLMAHGAYWGSGFAIGLVYSEDGETWYEYRPGNNPVLKMGPESWDGNYVSTPYIIEMGARSYKMYYGARPTATQIYNAIGVAYLGQLYGLEHSDIAIDRQIPWGDLSLTNTAVDNSVDHEDDLNEELLQEESGGIYLTSEIVTPVVDLGEERYLAGGSAGTRIFAQNIVGTTIEIRGANTAPTTTRNVEWKKGHGWYSGWGSTTPDSYITKSYSAGDKLDEYYIEEGENYRYVQMRIINNNNSDQLVIDQVLFTSAGEWEEIGDYVSVGDGTYSVTPAIMGAYNTEYHWKVVATDGVQSTEELFSFTTIPENYLPAISNPNPADEATNIPTYLTQLSFDLTDAQGDLMDYTITTSPDIGSDSVTDLGNGTYTVGISGLQEGMTYIWNIQVTDGVYVREVEYSFTTETYTVLISDETPEDGATGIVRNPTLGAYLFDGQGDSVDWEVWTDASGSWQIINSGTLPSGSGFISANPTNMTEGGTVYNWRVDAVDSGTGILVSESYNFTTKFPFEVRWSKIIGAQHRRGAAALADLNNDGDKEVVVGFMGGIRAYNQSDGSTLWTYYDGDIHSGGTMIEIADLNKDGVPEVICPLSSISGSSGILALHGDDGSLYWKRRDLGGALNDYDPLIFDIDGNGYPTIFTASKLDPNPGLWALNYDGTTRAEAHDTWKPCWGGISLMDYDNDGRFEIYLTDWGGPGGGGSRVWSYWADDLTLRWATVVPGGVNAEHPQLIDVTGDGIRDVVTYPGQCYPGQTQIYVLSAADGSILKYKNADGYISTCLVASIYDIDSDGNPELIGVTMNSDRDFIPATPTIAHMAVHDLVTFNRDAVVPLEHGNSDQPRVGNVYGDEGMEIVVPDGNNSLKIYSDSYELIEDIYLDSSCTLRHAKIADIDSDGYNEMVITAGGSPCDGPGSKVWVIDTDGVAPEVDPRVEVQSYSEYRLGVAEYVASPSGGCTGHGECGFCEKCEDGSCVVQAEGEDVKDDCVEGICSTGLCNGAGGCGIEPDTTVCRTAAGDCDLAETCNGLSATCPADGYLSGNVCRAAAGDCDAAETCDGLSVACPADTVEPGGALCRDIQGDCDLAETCDGLSATCPADTVEPGGTLCRDIQGDCDLAETCDGLSAACPADGYLSGNVCRGTAGDCDAAEICSGSSADCPPDGKSTGVCRVSAGECDLAESCDGVGNNCPADGKSTGLCRASVGECDLAESCDGVSNNCPADQLEPAATLCREAVSECDFAEYCTGDSTACPNDEFQPNATPCDDGLYCTQADECSEGECRGVGDPCPDNEEYCDGVEYCEEDTEDYLCSLTGDPCDPLTCDELDDTCLDSAVTLIIANAYGFSGTIDIELINEMDFVREVHLDVCNVDHHAWLHISTDSCSTTARTGGFICTISDQLNGCVRVDLTSPGDLINPGETGAIASLNYTLDVIAPVGDYADLMPENIEVRDDENVLLPVTPKPGKVGAVEIDSDDDGTPDHLDNCPHEHNPEQEDTSPPQGNEIGDACDCEGNFDCDQDVDGADAAIFKFDFGRSRYSNPCTNANPCHGDFDCDVDVDGTDASLFKSDFGRSQYQSPCPQCEAGDWCSYE